MKRKSDKKAGRTVLAIVITGGCLALATAQVCRHQAVALEPSSEAKAVQGGLRFREGTLLTDVLGHFRMTGDRATFYPLDSQASYAGLENLNLERVKLMISDSSDPLTWQVCGMITEYRGSNYILLNKAILKSQADAAEGSNASRKPKPPTKPAGKTRL